MPVYAGDAVVTNSVTDGVGWANYDFSDPAIHPSINGHPIGIAVSALTPDATMPLCAINVTTNLENYGRKYPLSAGGTGSDLSSAAGIPYLPGAGIAMTSVAVGTVPAGYALGTDGSTTPTFFDVITPSELTSYISGLLTAVTAGHVMYGTGGASIGHELNLFYDASNNRLGIGDEATYTAAAGPDYPAKTLSVWGDVGVYDPAAWEAAGTPEILKNGALTSGTYWNASTDATLTSNACTFAYSAGGLSSLYQTNLNFNSVPAASTAYVLTYTITIASGTPSATCYFSTNIAGAASLTMTNGTHTTLVSTGVGTNTYFTIDSVVASGESWTIDTLSLSPAVTDTDAKITLDNDGTIYASNLTLTGSAPTARIHLPAGTAAASTAPLKLTTGTLLGVAETGAAEFDGSDFYLTPDATRYGVALLDSPMSATGPGLIWQSASGAALANCPWITPIYTAPPPGSGYFTLASATNIPLVFRGYNNASGSGGDIQFNAGSGSGAGNVGGQILIQGGAGSSGATDGEIYIGQSATSKVVIGASAVPIGVGGITSPTARLHLPAGTATASTAPLKFTTGTALTAAEDGAMEYHTSHLYFTIGSTRYQLDQQGYTVADESTDTTCYPIFNTDATGTFAPKTDGYLLYNSNTGQLNAAALVINEDSEDKDTRFEGNGDENLLFLDAGNDRVGIGNNSPGEKLNVTGRIIAGGLTAHTPLYSTFDTQTTNVIEVGNPTSNSDVANGFGVLTMSNNTTNTAGVIGGIGFASAATGSTEKRIAFISAWNNGAVNRGLIKFQTNASGTVIESLRVADTYSEFNHDGLDIDFGVQGDTATKLLICDAGLDAVQIGTTTAGVLADFRTTGIVFNEDGTDRDIRFEGDTDANLLYLDAGNDRVGIGTASPGVRFHQYLSDAVTTSQTEIERIEHTTSGSTIDASGPTGFGTYRSWWLKDYLGNQNEAAREYVFYTLNHSAYGARPGYAVQLKNKSGAWLDALRVVTGNTGQINFAAAGGVITSGPLAVAIGSCTVNSNDYGACLSGSFNNTLSSGAAVCGGRNNSISGGNAVGLLASYCIVSGLNSIAIGDWVTSSGTGSVVIGTGLSGSTRFANSTDYATAIAGNNVEFAKFAPTAAVLNESGADIDFRIEGDTATNLFVCDAGLDAVQIGTTVAGAILDCRAAEVVGNDGGSATVDFRWEGDTEDKLFLIDTSADVVRMGDGDTNYVQVTKTGHMTFVGTATVWDDLRIEPVARTTGANAPTFAKWFDDAGGTSRGVYLYTFDDAAAGSEKEVFFTMQMPHAWASTPISLHVHWVGKVDDTTADPRWGLEYTWKDVGEVYGDTTIVYSDGTHVTFAGADANVTAGKHYITEFADLTPGTTADDISSILIGRLFRDSANAADTYNAANADCGLLYIDAHVEMNSFGSNSEYTKA